MNVKNSITSDVSTILEIYDHAISYQSKMEAVQWPKFTIEHIQKEIETEVQWKIMVDDQIACVWMTTFDDPHIWEDKNRDPSLYIHRIATNPIFRGNHFVPHIITWARSFAKKHHKFFIRMDTAGTNEKLISYYVNCGFTYLGAYLLTNTTELPVHYHNTPVCLFEIKL